MAKGKKGNTRARRVGYELIPRDHVESHPVYSLMGELVREHHEHLRDARIVAAWNLTWQPDADGRVKLVACVRANDLAREIVRPNACDELYAAVGVGLPREVPRGDDPRVAEVLVVFPYELAHERVNRVALDVIARDQFIADASRPGVPLFPFCHRCLLRE